MDCVFADLISTETMSTPANKKRALARKRCREELSNHLVQLGIHVHPSEVRLHPLEKDRYRWVFRDNNKHLFEKHLSDMSTNYYIELCDEVKKGNISATLIEMPTPEDEASADFGSQELEQELREIKEANERLQEEVNALKIREARLRMHNRRLRKLLSLLVGKATAFNQAVMEGEVQIKRALNTMSNLNKGTQGWRKLETLLSQNL